MLISQYHRVNLENLLLEQNWCSHLNELLYLLVAADLEDHDAIEKCILAMHSVADKCASYYSKDILVKLQNRYKTLALNDVDKSDEISNSDFFNNIYDLCTDILYRKNIKTEADQAL
ncbi:hypothetical protein NQ318_003717 [Aromia moschata]|uniref:Uncharacterized protein n=1 Tax=Aromia moschata TaxID=1265417 RepID=A0AAV8YFJ3_9CUCU|nr:hypothetical protein NQ318_003717 [Aromia moschata]